MDARNARSLARLADALGRAARGHEPLLALVGAGSSARVGYPLWEELLCLLEEEVARVHTPGVASLEAFRALPDRLWRAEECRRLLGEERFREFLRRTFAPRRRAGPDPFHAKLLRLPLGLVLTTNYDTVLEEAHEALTGEAPTVLLWSRDRGAILECAGHCDRCYAHLYGRFDDDVVLSEWDYRRRYVHASGTRSRLTRLLARHPLVVVGFSLTDLDLMSVFREVDARDERSHRGHFALLPLGPGQEPELFRRWLWGKYGIEGVFYPKSDDHEALDALLDALGQPWAGVATNSDGTQVGSEVPRSRRSRSRAARSARRRAA